MGTYEVSVPIAALQQDVGLVGGTSYTISFAQAIVRQSNFGGDDDTGAWTVYLGDSVLGTTATTTATNPWNSGALNWEIRTLNFVAPTTGAATIAFLPMDIDGDPNVRMGIDAVVLNQVPEPSSALLIGLAGSFGLLRRR